jgi:hypothetical protein
MERGTIRYSGPPSELLSLDVAKAEFLGSGRR